MGVGRSREPIRESEALSSYRVKTVAAATHFSLESDTTLNMFPSHQIRTGLFLGQCAWGVGLVTLLGLLALYDASGETAVYWLSLFLVGLSLWSLWSWKTATGHLLDLYSLFFIALILFSGGQSFLEVLGLNPHGILDGKFPIGVVRQALLLVVASMLVFHAGALYCAKSSVITTDQFPAGDFLQQALRTVGAIIIVLSIGPAMYELYHDFSLVQALGYTGEFMRAREVTGANAWTLSVAPFLVPGTLLLLAGSRGRRGNVILSWLLIGVPASIYVMLGLRNMGLKGIVALLWLHTLVNAPIKKAVLVFMMLMVFVLVPGLAAVRTERLTGMDRIGALLASYEMMENPLVLAIREMGGSFITIIYTTELVPQARSYEWGGTYLSALGTIFPNFFWDIHPSLAGGLPSYWLMKEVDPYAAKAGQTLGFSVIAEAYLNFSWVGTLVFMSGIGYILARFVLWVWKRPDPLRLAIEAIFISFVLFFARGDSNRIVRSIFWEGLIPSLLVMYVYNCRLTRQLHTHSIDAPSSSLSVANQTNCGIPIR